MPQMTPIALSITLATAGILGLIYIGLAVRVIMLRIRHRISLGDGGNTALLERMRSHGNFAEYVPLLLILMAMIELSGANTILMICAAVLLVLARISHVIGIEFGRTPNFFRTFGVAGTFILLATFCVWAILIALR